MEAGVEAELGAGGEMSGWRGGCGLGLAGAGGVVGDCGEQGWGNEAKLKGARDWGTGARAPGGADDCPSVRSPVGCEGATSGPGF